ncbi:MAG: transporter, partial [Moraxellaceae bacterium]
DISDASSVFFNPSAIGQLDSSMITLGGNAIFAKAEFTSTNSNTGGVAGKTDETGYVPNLYWVTPVSERLTFGLGVNAPYGLASKYDEDWVGRYLATHSELEIVNINAVLAIELTDNFSLGLGVDYQRAEVTLESQIDSTFGINPGPARDSSAKIQGDDDDISADVSLYFQPSDQTSIGVIWRQGGEFDLEGTAAFSLNAICSPGAGYPTGAPPRPTTGTLCAVGLGALQGNAKASVQLPDTVTLSGSHKLGEHWRFHGDVAWTQWSNIQTIDVVNSSNNLAINQLDLRYEDSMRYAVGFSYESNSPWTWRFGVALDEAPQTDPALLSPRIPDQDRTWFSGGFNYEISQSASIDVGLSHIRVDEASINNTDAQTGHHVEGSFDASVNIVGVQGNWRF